MSIIKIKPTHPSQGEFVIIEKKDFDPSKHELCDGESLGDTQGDTGEGVPTLAELIASRNQLLARGDQLDDLELHLTQRGESLAEAKQLLEQRGSELDAREQALASRETAVVEREQANAAEAQRLADEKAAAAKTATGTEGEGTSTGTAKAKK